MRLARWLSVVFVAVMLLPAPGLAEGRNEVYLKPDNKKSWSEWLADLVDYRGFSKSYALVIGINNYTNGYQYLPTQDDPLKMFEFLKEDAGFDHVHLLTNEKATLLRIRQLMTEKYPPLIDDNDRFLFYWSGHGDQQEIEEGGFAGYLPLANSTKGQYETMVGMNEFERWNRLLKAQHVLFLLDACFSGLSGSAEKRGMQDLRIEQLMLPARHLIAAGTGKEATIASDRWGGSIFTYSLLKAAKGEADASTSSFPSDRVISLYELYEDVQKRVADERVKAGWSKSITPQIRDLGGSIGGSKGQFFFLAKNSEEVVGPDPAPPPDGTAEKEPPSKLAAQSPKKDGAAKPAETETQSATLPPADAREEDLIGSFDGEWNLEFIHKPYLTSELRVNKPMVVSQNRFSTIVSGGGNRGTLTGRITDDGVLKVTAEIKRVGNWAGSVFHFSASYENDEFRSAGEHTLNLGGPYSFVLSRPAPESS